MHPLKSILPKIALTSALVVLPISAIAGCSQNNAIKNGQLNSSISKHTSIPLVTEQEVAMHNYHDYIINLTQKYGILTRDPFNAPIKDSTSGQRITGIGYANLIDFSKDGHPDLFIVYSDGFNYIVEVWGVINNEMTKLFSKSIPIDGGLIGSDTSVATTDTTANSYIVFTSESSTGNGPEPYTNQGADISSFYTLKNNKFVETKRLEDLQESTSDGESRESFHDKTNNIDKIITKSDYEQEFAKLNNNRFKIINSNYGSESLAIDATQNVEEILSLIQMLEKKATPDILKDSFGALNIGEKNELIWSLHYFTPFANIDIRKNSDAQIANFLVEGIVSGVINSTTLPQDSTKSPISVNGFSYTPFLRSNVDKVTTFMFGKTLSPEDQAVNGQKEIIYKDNEFYILFPQTGSSPTIISPQVDHVYSLGNGLYYVEYTNYAFSFDELQSMTDFYQNQQYWKAFDTWPEQAKEQAISDFQYGLQAGSALLKKTTVGSTSSWTLIEKSDGSLLTPRQLITLKQSS